MLIKFPFIKKTILNFLLIIASVTVSLAVLILTLTQFEFTRYGRLISSISYADLFDTTYPYRRLKSNIDVVSYTPWGKPFDVATDPNGIRQSDYNFSSESSMKIFVYGDSQTFGYGLDNSETIISKLNEKSHSNDSDLIFFNRGVSGIGLEEIYQILEADIRSSIVSQNDRIAVNVYVNDILDSLVPASQRAKLITSINDQYEYKTKLEYLIELAKSAYHASKVSHDVVGYVSNVRFEVSNLPADGITIYPQKLNEDIQKYLSDRLSADVEKINLVANDDDCISFILARDQLVKSQTEICLNRGFNSITLDTPIEISKGDRLYFFDDGLSTVAMSTDYSSYKNYTFGLGVDEGNIFTDNDGSYALQVAFRPVSIDSRLIDLDAKILLGKLQAGLEFYDNANGDRIFDSFREALDTYDCGSIPDVSLLAPFCLNSDLNSSQFDIFWKQVQDIEDLATKNSLSIKFIYLPSIYSCILLNDRKTTTPTKEAPFSRGVHKASNNHYVLERTFSPHCEYFLQDSHYNERGAKAIANQIFDYFLEN